MKIETVPIDKLSPAAYNPRKNLTPIIAPAQSLEIIRQTHSFVDLFKVGKLNHHSLAATIDWRIFGHDVQDLLESLGKRYYLKRDLRAYMQKAS